MTVLINFDKRSSLGEIIERVSLRAGYRLWSKRPPPRRLPQFWCVDPESGILLLGYHKKWLEECGRDLKREINSLSEEIIEVETR